MKDILTFGKGQSFFYPIDIDDDILYSFNILLLDMEISVVNILISFTHRNDVSKWHKDKDKARYELFLVDCQL